jgi:hypothetical protein
MATLLKNFALNSVILTVANTYSVILEREIKKNETGYIANIMINTNVISKIRGKN